MSDGRPPTPPFEQALAAIRNGAHYSIEGLTLTVNGIALAITGEQFELAWEAMDEVDGHDSTPPHRFQRGTA